MSRIKPSYGGPEAESIERRSVYRWRAALSNARAASQYRVSPSDLRALLSRIPSLPDHIPSESKSIQGYSTWRATSKCTLVTKRERPRTIMLTNLHPIICKTSSSGNFQQWESSRNNGLALMTLGWAYVLGSSLAERQGLALQYHNSSETSISHTKKLQLEYATCHERTWWKALTSPGVGWKIADRGSPWGLSIKDFDLEVIGQIDQKSTPPTASQAASYLSRLCIAFDLGNQLSAGLVAALSLPLIAAQKLWESAQIELPASAMNLVVQTPKKKKCPPPEFRLISYYMTLSLSHWAFGPTLWSVFWEPQITCNFAGAWLGPIAAVLEPVLSSNNLELLAKVFAFTNAAPLWVGITLCGCSSIIKCILPYLTNVYNYPFTLPSIDAAAWTGIPQSFFDNYQTEPCLDGTISRAEIWRLRHDCHSNYQDSAFLYTPSHGWPPFGNMQAEDVELEIRDHIYCSHKWNYAYWTWQPGARTDTGFCKRNEESARVQSDGPQIGREDAGDIGNLINYGVSKSATRLMFHWCSSQVERGFGGTVVKRFYGHDDSKIRSVESVPSDVKNVQISDWFSAVEQSGGETSPYDKSNDDSEDELIRS